MPDNPLTSLEHSSEEEVEVVLVHEEPPAPLKGLYAQYFVVGLVYGVLPGTLYGFYLGYLEVESHVYATASQVIALPWSFKFIFGMLNDCAPIKGYRRVSYMAIGWTICATALAVIANTDMPPRGDKDAAGAFAARMAVAAVGYVMADVAADGLTVQLAKKEPLHSRGTIQSTAYLVRTLGSIVAALFVGIAMNGHEYNGSFDFTLSFTQVCGTVAVPTALMAPISWLYIEESPAQVSSSFRTYLRGCWDILETKAMFYVVVYSIGHSVVGGISTTASGNVALVWAKVGNLQAQLFTVVSMGIFAVGLALVKKHLLNYSWRKIIAATTLALGLVDGTFVFLTIFDVVRNQYFFLGEDILVMIPAAAKFLVTTFVVVEMAPEGKEGITYGMLTTLHNLGGPIARGISNQIYGQGFEGLTDAANYVKDTDEFRQEVAWSYGVGYITGLLALGFLYYMPDQKAETLDRIKNWGSSKIYAQVTVATVCIAWVYAVTVNLLVMFPATACSEWVGGSGC